MTKCRQVYTTTTDTPVAGLDFTLVYGYKDEEDNWKHFNLGVTEES